MKDSDDIKPGTEIYVESRIFISHGSDEFVGGLATVSNVSKETIRGKKCVIVEVVEDPSTEYNWSRLSLKQEKLKEHFGNSRAHADPDVDTPFMEAGDYIGNGQLYKGDPIW